MADTTTSGEPVTATTIGNTDLVRISQDLGGGTFGNAKLSGASLKTEMAGVAPVQSVNAQTGTVVLAAADVGAVPTTRTVNGHALSANVTVTAADAGAAPTTRAINTSTGLSGGGDLSADRTLSIANTTVSAASYGSATQVGTFTVNAQGQLTAAANVTVTPLFSSITSKPTTLAGYGITDALIFKTISVSGQSDVVADSSADVLTLVAGSGMTITTDASTDTITLAASGGGGSPGGSAQQIQYNNSGAFGGIQNSTFDGTNLILQASIGGFTILQGGASGGDIYTSPGNGGGNWYATNVKVADPQLTDALYNDNGVLTFSGSPGAYLASALMNQVNWWPIAGSTLPSMVGSTSTTTGLTWSSIVAGAATNAATRQQRARGSTAASAGATGVYASTSVGQWTGAGLGMYAEFLTGVGTNLTGHQCFVGLTTNATSLAGDPSALTNVIGIGFDAADLSSGNWQFYTNDGSGTATKTDTGIARGTAQLLWVQLYNLPNSVTWNVTITDMVVGTVYSNLALATNTPASGSVMRLYQSVRTGATTTAAAIDSMRAFMKWKSG